MAPSSVAGRLQAYVKFLVKFTVLGPQTTTAEPMGVKFGVGVRQISPHRCNVSPLRYKNLKITPCA